MHCNTGDWVTLKEGVSAGRIFRVAVDWRDTLELESENFLGTSLMRVEPEYVVLLGHKHMPRFDTRGDPVVNTEFAANWI